MSNRPPQRRGRPGRAGASDQIQQIPLNLWIDFHEPQSFLGRRETSKIEDGVEHYGGPVQAAVQHLQFLVAAWVVDSNLHEEPIELRLGQRIRAFVLDRILSR